MTVMQRLLLCLGALLVLLLPVRQSAAHPHVYVDATLTFVADDSGLQAIEQHWLFDEIFTQAILADLGLDQASLATTLGQEKIRSGAFAYLANYDYFTLMENDGERLPVSAEMFTADLRDNRLVYEFTVPVGLPLDRIRDFRAAVFDKDYYTDVLLLKDAIGFEIDGMIQASHVVRPAKDHTYWQYIVPEAVHLSLSATPGSATDLPPVELEEAPAPGLIEQIMSLVRETQKTLTLKLNGFGMDIRDNPLGSALWMFLGLSFLYGVVHAVGPGHGKTVVCSYFLSNPGSFFQGAVMGNAITFVHMGSAAVAVGLAYAVFSTGLGGFAEASRTLQPASYGLLVLMGMFLTVKAVRDALRGGPVPDVSCPVDHAEMGRSGNLREVLTVSFVTGLVPCPGAAVILAFAIGQGIFWAGAGAIMAMAVGMGLTTTLFAFAAVAARGVTLRLTGRNRRLFTVLYAGLSICGALAITVFGAALFLGSSGWHALGWSPFN